MQCPSCHAEVDPDAVYCQVCGTRIDELVETASNERADEPAEKPQRGDAGTAGNRLEAAAGERGQVDDEHFLWEGGYSGKAMIGTWILSGLISLVAVVLAAYFKLSGTYWLLIFVGIVLVWVAGAATLAYRKLNVGYRVTSQRLVHESGILRRVTNRIEVIDMDDITFEQGFVERLVNVGSIRIDSSDRSHPVFWLRGIEDVRNVASLIDNARRDERSRRGLYIESI